MVELLRFKLCGVCWRSKGINSFSKSYRSSDGPETSKCAKCQKLKIPTPRRQYYDGQAALPVESRNRVCTSCFIEKNESVWFFKKGSGRFNSRCRECIKPYSKMMYEKKMASGGLTEKEKESQKFARQRWYQRKMKDDYESFRLIMNERYRAWYRTSAGSKSTEKRNDICRLQVNTLPPDYWDILLKMSEVCMFPGCQKSDDLEYDHIVPVSWGLMCDWSMLNAQILCKSHNCSKNNRYSMDFRPMIIPLEGEEDCEYFDIRNHL